MFDLPRQDASGEIRFLKLLQDIVGIERAYVRFYFVGDSVWCHEVVFGIFIVFIVFFILFMAIFLNRARSRRVKPTFIFLLWLFIYFLFSNNWSITVIWNSFIQIWIIFFWRDLIFLMINSLFTSLHYLKILLLTSSFFLKRFRFS